jgi:hypothetical protein
MQKNTNPFIAKLQMEAEQAWNNYSGSAAGGKKNEFVSMAGGRLSNMSGVVSQTGIKTITFDIVNTDEANDLAVVLFGANEGFIQPFNGVKCPITGNTAAAGKGIVATPKRYSMSELIEKSKTEPFTFVGYRYDFGDELQLKQDWRLRRKEGTAIIDDLHSPSEMRNLANNISTAMDNPEFFQLIDPKAALFITLAKAPAANVSRKIQVIFKVGTEANLGNVLKGQGVLVQNGMGF